MDKLVLRVFVREVELQCIFANLAYQDLRQALADSNTEQVFFAAQALLGAVGNVSKLLWPTKTGNAERGTRLREVLAVSDDSPIAPRTFRNHFEHFDERLDEWTKSSKRKNFADLNIGPPEFISGLDAEDFLRNFDQTSFILTFRKDKYEINKVMQALQLIYKNAQHEVKRLLWD